MRTPVLDELFRAMAAVSPYPPGVLPIQERISGTAFFPGGDGVWRSSTTREATAPFPIMILGQDFDSRAGFERALARGSEVPAESDQWKANPTWRNLIALFGRVGIEPSACFFTNAFMGLRESAENTGRFPGAKDKDFAGRCRAFLSVQIRAVQPRLVFTLGSWVPRFLAEGIPELSHWKESRSLRDLDRVGPLAANVRLIPQGGSVVTVAALTHPSLRNVNVGRRRYASLHGDDAELRLISDALVHAGLNTRVT